MENKHSQTSTRSGRTATVTTPASTAVKIVLAIPGALLTAIKAAVETNQFYTDPAGYAHIIQCIISKLLECKNMLNEIESLQK